MKTFTIEDLKMLVASGLDYVGMNSIPHEVMQSNHNALPEYSLRFWTTLTAVEIMNYKDGARLVTPIIDAIKGSPLVKDLEKEITELKEALATSQRKYQELACYVRVQRSITHNLPLAAIQL